MIFNVGFYILLGFFSNSPFATIKSMKNLNILIFSGLIWCVVLTTFSVYPGNFSIIEMEKWMLLKLPISSISIIFLSLVEMEILMNTKGEEVELISGIETEYSGSGLALIEMSKWMKLLFLILLITKLLINPSGSQFLIYSLLVFIFLTILSIFGGRNKSEYFLVLLTSFLVLDIIEFILVFRFGG